MAISDLDYTDDSDVALIRRTRTGDSDAFGILHTRHVGSARALAWRMSRSASDADDLVSEGFARVLSALQRGSGPEVAFRPYLLSTIRRLAYDRTDRERREAPVEYDLDEPTTATDDPVLAGFEKDTAAAAFASLPERWRLVLWHTEVEGQKPAEVAQLLGIKPNAVAALAYRAREGLRQAYLTHHSTALPTSDHECRLTNDRLAAYIRGGLAAGHEERVRRHLDGCDECRAAYLELANVNTALRSLVGLALLGPAAGLYLAEVAFPTAPAPAPHPAPAPAAAPAAAGTAGAALLAAGGTAAGAAALARRRARMAGAVAAGVLGLAAVAGWFANRPTSERVDLAQDRSSTSLEAAPATDGTSRTTERTDPADGGGRTTTSGAPSADPAVADPLGSGSGSLPGRRRGGLDGPSSPGAGGIDLPTDPGSGKEPVRGVESPYTTTTPAAPPISLPPVPTTQPPVPTTQPPVEPIDPAQLVVGVEGAGTLVADQAGTVTASVTNAGLGPAGTVTLTLDVAPLALRGQHPQGGWQCAPPAGTTLTCTSGPLAPGATRSIYVPVLPGSAGPIQVRGAATGANVAAAPTPDPVPLTVEPSGLSARFASVDRGDVITAGNTLVTCPLVVVDCAAARAGVPAAGDVPAEGVTHPSLNNNTYDMVPTNTAPGLGATNSSTSRLALPAGSTVVSATLVAGADLAPDASGTPASEAGLGQALVQAPDGTVHSVSAEREDRIGTRYQNVIDVTDLVAANGGGLWSVGGLPIGTGKNAYGGWALVVVVHHDALPLRSLVVLDGLADVASGQQVDLRVGGYVVPDRSNREATLQVVAYEGDRGTGGDSLLIDGVNVDPRPVGDPYPSGNLFDSSAASADRTPSDANLFGFDLDRLAVGPRLAPGSTSSTITLRTVTDAYLPGVVTFTVDQ